MGEAGLTIGTFFVWCLAAFVVALVVGRVINAWIVDHTLESWQALALIAAQFLLAAVIIRAERPYARFAVFMVMLGIVGATNLISAQRERRQLKQLQEEDAERYRAVIARDPYNSAAHVFLGDAMMQLGRVDEAIDAYQTAVNLLPEYSTAEDAKLRSALAEKARRMQGARRKCPQCHTESPSGTHTCPKCGTALTMQFMRWMADPKNLREIILRSGPPLLLIIAIVSSLWVFPLPVVGCILCALLIVGLYLLLRRLGGDQ